MAVPGWSTITLAALLVVVGCASAPRPELAEDEPGVADGTFVAEPVPDVIPEEPEPPPVAAEPEVVPGEPLPIAVDEEVYSQAFAEVSEVIEELNAIIARGDFRSWVGHLTERYRLVYSDADVLARLSRQPVLLQSNITLRSLEDYFRHVVVPSRARARLDDLVFYSDTLVEAVTEFRGQVVILYLLRKIDDEWRIDTFEELPSG